MSIKRQECAFECVCPMEKNKAQMFAQKFIFSLFSSHRNCFAGAGAADISTRFCVRVCLSVYFCTEYMYSCRYGNRFDIRNDGCRYVYAFLRLIYCLFRCKFSVKFIPPHFSAFIHTIYGNLVFMKY